MTAPVFRKWLVAYFFDVLKHIGIVVGHAAVYLAIVGVFAFVVWFESKIHAKPEDPSPRPPAIFVIVEAGNASKSSSKKSLRTNNKNRAKTPCKR